uniref:Uncharacterized protein n=1 Tax=Strongyloides venezuelensis TaxID=75913 RepID=A0A0K0F3V9_STRVS
MILILILYATITILTLFSPTFGCSNRNDRGRGNDKCLAKKENAASTKKQKVLQDIIPMEKNKPKRKCRRYKTNKFHIRKNGSIKELATGTSNYFLPSSLNSIPIKMREERTLYGLKDTVAFGNIKRYQQVFKGEVQEEEENKHGIFTIVSRDYVDEKPDITIVPFREKTSKFHEDNNVVAFIHRKRKIYGVNTFNK